MTQTTDMSFFQYSELGKYLRYLDELADVVSLGKWDGSKAVIMRHDVDVDLGLACRLVKLEVECGVRSSYFIRVTCPFYNPLEASSREMIRWIASSGFEVGLHFDPLAYGKLSKDEMRTQVDREAELLASLSGQRVVSISLHNPSVHGKYPLFAGYRNAYDKLIFDDDRYLSDSRFSFRDKDPHEFVKRVKDHPIQILLHPLHYSERGDGYPEIYRRLLSERIDEMDRDFRLNSTYCEQIGGSLLDYLLKNGGRS